MGVAQLSDDTHQAKGLARDFLQRCACIVGGLHVVKHKQVALEPARARPLDDDADAVVHLSDKCQLGMMFVRKGAKDERRRATQCCKG